jgi:hypothetical protein
VTRDPAVDAVFTAETLLDQLSALVPELKSLLAADVKLAAEQMQHLYPELWAQLDHARALLRARGVDVPDYDVVRAQQPAAMLGVQRKDADGAFAIEMAAFIAGGALFANIVTAATRSTEANRSGLAAADHALRALHDAMPQIAWARERAVASRQVNVNLRVLRAATRRKLLAGALGLVVASAFAFGLVKLLEKPKEETLTQAMERQVRELEAKHEDKPCDAPATEQLMSKLRILGKSRRAKAIGTEFLAKCGENAAIRQRVGLPRVRTL